MQERKMFGKLIRRVERTETLIMPIIGTEEVLRRPE